MENKTVLYISSILPARSETFVYREIFALRALGVNVLTASVHNPEKDLGSPELDDLASASIQVYGSGGLMLVLDSFVEALCHPLRAFLVFSMASRDALFGSDLSGVRRVKVLVQAFSAFALARRVRHLGIVHIHAHMAHVPTTIAMYTSRQLGIGFSFTGHANDIFPNRSLLKEKIERSLFVSCISRWHREFYQSVYPKEETSLPVIRCGVDTAKESFEPAFHDDTLRILSVGRLVPKKGFDVLIEAVGIVARQGLAAIELTIAGSGPEEEHLRRLAARLSSSVKLNMLGSVENQRVMELMAKCELFVLPLRITSEGDRDGIPVVLMEAMARGRCVVSGDLVTIRELIENGTSGYLIPTGDVDALVKVLEELVGDRSRIDRLGVAARKRIINEFDVNLNAKLLLKAMIEAGLEL